MSKDTEKTKARKRLQVSNEKYRDNYERIFGKSLWRGDMGKSKRYAIGDPLAIMKVTEIDHENKTITIKEETK